MASVAGVTGILSTIIFHLSNKSKNKKFSLFTLIYSISFLALGILAAKGIISKQEFGWGIMGPLAAVTGLTLIIVPVRFCHETCEAMNHLAYSQID